MVGCLNWNNRVISTPNPSSSPPWWHNSMHVRDSFPLVVACLSQRRMFNHWWHYKKDFLRIWSFFSGFHCFAAWRAVSACRFHMFAISFSTGDGTCSANINKLRQHSSFELKEWKCCSFSGNGSDFQKVTEENAVAIAEYVIWVKSTVFSILLVLVKPLKFIGPAGQGCTWRGKKWAGEDNVLDFCME